MESDFHARQVRAAALDIRVQAIEATRSFIPPTNLLLENFSDYGRSMLSVNPLYTASKRSRRISYEEIPRHASKQPTAPAHSLFVLSYQVPVQKFYLTSTLSEIIFTRLSDCAGVGVDSHGGIY